MINRRNWHDTREYLTYLRKTKKLDPKSTQTYKSYLNHLLLWAGESPLWSPEQINPSFCDYLLRHSSSKTGNSFSRSACQRILGLVTRFYSWARTYHPELYSQVSQLWIDALVVPYQAKENYDDSYVNLETVRKIRNLYFESDEIVIKRDCAAAVMLFLSGMRAGAFVSVPIKLVKPNVPGFPDLMEIHQYPELGVRTKNRKHFRTQTLPIPDLVECSRDWDIYVRSKISLDALWFPILKNQWGDVTLTVNPAGQHRGQILNRRLRIIFTKIGYSYQSAQKFRRGHAHWALSRSRNLEQYKGISLNLGHRSMAITDQYYSKFNTIDRRKLISSLGDD